MVNPKPAPITNSGLFSAHLSSTARMKECNGLRPMISAVEKKVANTAKTLGRNAIRIITYKGTQFIVQTPNDAPKTNVTNTSNDCLATAGDKGSKSQSNGTERMSNVSNEMLEIINTRKKFESNNETAETTRPAAQISRSTIRHRTNEQKNKTTFAISSTA
jgi:hypothetical protein